MIENSYSAHKNLQLWTWFIKNVHNSYVCEAVCTKPRGPVWWRQIRMLFWKWNRNFMDLNVMMTFYKYKPVWAVGNSPWDRKTFRAIHCFNSLSRCCCISIRKGKEDENKKIGQVYELIIFESKNGEKCGSIFIIQPNNHFGILDKYRC